MVRVVGDNVDVNIYPINKAKEMARQQGLDLVEISPNSDHLSVKLLTILSSSICRKRSRSQLDQMLKRPS